MLTLHLVPHFELCISASIQCQICELGDIVLFCRIHLDWALRLEREEVLKMNVGYSSRT